jgi:hypothetical protein
MAIMAHSHTTDVMSRAIFNPEMKSYSLSQYICAITIRNRAKLKNVIPGIPLSEQIKKLKTCAMFRLQVSQFTIKGQTVAIPL